MKNAYRLTYNTRKGLISRGYVLKCYTCRRTLKEGEMIVSFRKSHGDPKNKKFRCAACAVRLNMVTGEEISFYRWKEELEGLYSHGFGDVLKGRLEVDQVG